MSLRLNSNVRRNEIGQIVSDFAYDQSAMFARILELKAAKVYPFSVKVAEEFGVTRAMVSQFYFREKKRRARLQAKQNKAVAIAQAKLRLCQWCETPMPPVVGQERYRYCCAGCAVQANVKREGDCWVWQKSLVCGYGQLVFRGQSGGPKRRAHQIAFECFTGEKITRGMWVLHSCDNPACCNPRHLRLGTPLENNREAIAKGRNSHGEKRPASKLTDAIVLAIRRDKSTSSTELAQRHGVSVTALCCARTGATWRHLPLDPATEDLAA